MDTFTATLILVTRLSDEISFDVEYSNGTDVFNRNYTDKHMDGIVDRVLATVRAELTRLDNLYTGFDSVKALEGTSITSDT